jgi:hypothetical protein
MAQPDDGSRAAVTLVDSHVHLHDCFAVPAFLDAASANLASVATDLGLPAGTTGCLLFTESQGVDHFAALAAGASPTGAWRLQPTDEAVSLIARKPDAAELILIAGRQIVCREGLEVLALGTSLALEDGQPMREVIARVSSAGAIPVVPWGFGKWQGARGKLIAGLLDRRPDGPLYFGDNGGRLGIGPRPKLFERAEAGRVAVLPGSDPLPFRDQVARVGSYGFVAKAGLDATTPFAALRCCLDGLAESPQIFGKLSTLPDFVRCQIAMQMHKRFGRRP